MPSFTKTLKKSFNGERGSTRPADPQQKTRRRWREEGGGWTCRKLGGLAGQKKLEEEISERVANDGRLINYERVIPTGVAPACTWAAKKNFWYTSDLDTACDHHRKVTWLLSAAAAARLSKGNRGTQTSIIVHSANGNVGSKLQVMLPGQPRPLVCEWLPKNSIAGWGSSSIQQCT